MNAYGTNDNVGETASFSNSSPVNIVVSTTPQSRQKRNFVLVAISALALTGLVASVQSFAGLVSNYRKHGEFNHEKITNLGGSNKGKNSGTLTGPSPNVVLFYVDDLPYWSEYAETPQVYNGVIRPHPLMENLNKLRDEGLVFSQAYAAEPMCAPARFSTLTLRYCSRSHYAIDQTLTEYRSAEEDVTLAESNTDDPSDVSGNGAPVWDGRTMVDDVCALYGPDLTQTLPNTLQHYGYRTIHAGKWNIAPTADCNFGNYTQCVDFIKQAGFTAATGVYGGVINRIVYNNPDLHFSHNMEWVTASAMEEMQTAIDASQPFFLHFAPTIPNGGDVYESALFDYSVRDTPSGTLHHDPVSHMPTRDSVWARATDYDASTAGHGWTSGIIWLDDSLGAIYNFLDSKGVLDDTMIVFAMDHGVSGKHVLSEDGLRTYQVVRYPGLMSHHSAGEMVSGHTLNMDIGATILDYIGVNPPYKMDGQSWLPLVTKSATHLADYRMMEAYRDRSILSKDNYRYISKSWISSAKQRTKIGSQYPHYQAAEQLYDLSKDPTMQTNLAGDPHYSHILNNMRYWQCDADGKLDPDYDDYISPSRCPVIREFQGDVAINPGDSTTG
eukprot:CAMPEP_0113936368 /NCGR_PEP_ID=MMETSP1339-20121228/3301_1 /TAXON_ID=94617 /ORGANISM="Fibrocapsa japonica" /LENGTH=610 /DNA_ID=CAMNT_0000938827 /DNA_START=48 /DNA_END=1880 /DNA_ORIENTATION=+ /assembly_acc=CAM_ASM_000762